MTNAELAKSKNFTDFCKKIGVEPTKRQAGKQRRNVGIVARAMNGEDVTLMAKNLEKHLRGYKRHHRH